MRTHSLQDGVAAFNVSLHKAAVPSPVVLFAVGAGGQPERHCTLLNALTESGCTVIAPHFERLASHYPGEAELTLRARRLSLALDAFIEPGKTAVGVGHSIGATTLLALAGAQMWLRPGHRIEMATDSRLTRLALLAPASGFFQAPGALDAMRAPILAWVGTRDGITPPAQISWLADALRNRQTVEVRVTEGADHFSFMDRRPPQTSEPLADSQAFLREVSSEVFRFVVAQ